LLNFILIFVHKKCFALEIQYIDEV
jgi:hypothetical protein